MGEAKGLTDSEVKELCQEPDPATEAYFLNHTMYRVKDPRVSIPFYTKILGMRLLNKLDMPNLQFTLYFLGYEKADEISKCGDDKMAFALSKKSVLELTHNWGSENDPNLSYHDGNSEPRGYGHIAVHVPDVYSACERFKSLGVVIAKAPDQGRMKGIAFIKDPDGYMIELVNSGDLPVAV